MKEINYTKQVETYRANIKVITPEDYRQRLHI